MNNPKPIDFSFNLDDTFDSRQNEINGKNIKVLMLDNFTDYLNETFIVNAISKKTIKEYESSDCVIYMETLFNMNKTQINDFYTKHYVFIESFIDKYLKLILIVSFVIIIFTLIITVVLVKYIRKKCNGGYTAVRTNKSIELGEFTP